MKMPKMPYSPINMDAEMIAFLKTLEDKWFVHPTIKSLRYKVSSIEITGIIGNTLYVLGEAGPFGELRFGMEKDIESSEVKENVFKPYYRGLLWIFTAGLYGKIPYISAREKQTNEYWKRYREIRTANERGIDEKIKDIKVFQGTIGEIEKSLGVKLEMVELSKPETFIKADNIYWLRAEAGRAGANLVVHYQPGSAVGTPVKIIGKN